MLGLPGAAEAHLLIQEGYPGDHLTLQPRQQAQVRLSTWAGGLGWPSTEARKISAAIGSRFGILPEVPADLTSPLGGRVKSGLPESSTTAQLGRSLRGIRDTWEVPKGAIARHRP